MSSRQVMLETIKNELSKVRLARYYVRRGPIDWATFDFTKNPFAMSLSLAETTFMTPDGVNRGIVSIECFARMPELKDKPTEFSDATLDEMLADIEFAIRRSLQTKIKGDNVLFLADGQSLAIEVSDAELKVQGVVVDIEVKF